jgi:hypothetical protein
MDINLAAPAPPLGATAAEDAAYDRLHPYHAELCALTEIRKKPGFGVALHSGIGGHCLLYLNGVELDRTQNYPVLKLSPPETAASNGVGISVNAHYKNANWVAAAGRDFLWRGALEPGEPVTRDSYRRTQKQAQAQGLLDGINFQDHLFRDKPADMSAQDFMYEISIATDYAARFGRDIFRARLPLDQARMACTIAYLNALNAPYRDGEKIFRWKVLNNNCVHVVHNALAAAGVWKPWPTGQFIARAAFNFPVPKNAFVDLMLRANDLPIDDPEALFADPAARDALLKFGTLPAVPGALARAESALPGKEIYDTNRLRIIFFDNPFWGPYRFRFARIFAEPRFTDPATNLQHFAALYATAKSRSGVSPKMSIERAKFQRLYDAYIASADETLHRQRTAPQPPAARPS